MRQKRAAAGIGGTFLLALMTAVCTQSPGGKDLELKRFSMDTLEGVIQKTGVELDKQVKSEGAGGLRVTVTEPSIIRLFETGPLDIEEATLVYRARLRTENAQGNVYLEMWCRFPGIGELFSRGLQSPLRGTNDWTTQEIPFFLKKGTKPDVVKLNVVSEGAGVIWIDDIRLLKRTLPTRAAT
ncbi:MAG: hypothetical protein A2W03_03140 [Candidatus Aminicenantes bacterium RBG_16_63_16]|nr:MAG: hypothetical protein A2W03_03140 [Candidatus Aminicenantes bacterium RBG_16_63_16]